MTAFRRIVAGALLAATIFLLFLTLKNPIGIKNNLYGIAREVMKKSLELQTFNWFAIEGAGFRVKYQPVDASVARLVLETAEAAYEPVNQMLGYAPNENVPIYIYPTKETLNKSFKWDGAVNAMGVYWAGAIRILSPLEWITDEENLTPVFQENGPIVHEYAHLLVDYRTHGNYPRWLTEGIAQYVEREVTGFVLPEETILGNYWYSLESMDDKFDLLPNQNLAYRQSLLVIDYLVEQKGFDVVLELLDLLAQGKNISDALEGTVGQNLQSFEASFRQWAAGQQ